jgi:SOS response regulatory protein OraA/RecX
MSQTAFQYSIRLLSVRDYSEYKLSSKLKDRGYTQDDIQDTVQRLKELNYLREEEYLKIRVKQLMVKGHSNHFIIHKCQEEQLTPSNELIDAIRNEQGFDNITVINKLVEKKLRNKCIPNDFNEKQKLKAKVCNFLRSKGHDLSECLPIIDEQFKNLEMEDNQ